MQGGTAMAGGFIFSGIFCLPAWSMWLLPGKCSKSNPPLLIGPTQRVARVLEEKIRAVRPQLALLCFTRPWLVEKKKASCWVVAVPLKSHTEDSRTPGVDIPCSVASAGTRC